MDPGPRRLAPDGDVTCDERRAAAEHDALRVPSRDVGGIRARAALAGPRTTLDVIEDAGDWVHVDAPEALREVVLGHLDAG
jgi:hypothetical protein